MESKSFFEKIRNGEPVSFEETMTVISENYDYQPTAFLNGLSQDILVNPPGTNEGSCKIFAFAQIHQLDEQQTLDLFGDFYRVEVLANPKGSGHGNIRNFMRYGWAGIQFNGVPLVVRKRGNFLAG